MIGVSTAEFVFIRVCILFLHHIAPVSLLYCLIRLVQVFLWPALGAYRPPLVAEAWLFAEAAFYTIFFLPYRFHLQRSATHPAPAAQEERRKLFDRCNENVEDPEKYLSQWFLGADKNQIKRENVKEFFAWAFLNAGHVKEDDAEEIERYTTATEELLGRHLPPGRGSAECLRLTLDSVDCLHRSLLWYLCVGVVDAKMFCTMLYNGFAHHRTSLGRFFTLFPFRPLALLSPHKSPVTHITYWHRPHTSKSRLPILFVHGIGIGLYPYTSFLHDLNVAANDGNDDTEVGIIAIEIMPVSFRLTHAALTKDEMVREIHTIVKHHGWDKFILASHSYGSIISTHLLKSPLTAPLVGPVLLIDPISFLLHRPDVAFNFTARTPSRANEHQLWYFASKDMGVAHTLARTFFWTENILWKEDLQRQGSQDGDLRDVSVVLSGRDLILDTDAVRRYLLGSRREVGNAINSKDKNTGYYEEKSTIWTGSGLDLLWFEDLDHAQVFDRASTRRQLVDVLLAYSAASSNAKP